MKVGALTNAVKTAANGMSVTQKPQTAALNKTDATRKTAERQTVRNASRHTRSGNAVALNSNANQPATANNRVNAARRLIGTLIDIRA